MCRSRMREVAFVAARTIRDSRTVEGGQQQCFRRTMEMPIEPSVTLHLTRMSDEAVRRIARSAEPYLEPGETARVAVWGQNTPLHGASLLGWLLILKTAGFVTLVATDRYIYVFRRGFLQNARIQGCLERLPIHGTHAELNRLSGTLTIGSRRFGISALVAQGDARKLVEFVSRRSSAE